MTHYDTIGASPGATQAQLRRAYLIRARALHPDQFMGRPPAERARAERRMQELNAAWAELSTPERRKKYDAGLQRGAQRAGTGPVVDARAGTWMPYDRSTPTIPQRRQPRAPQVAEARDMEIRGMAKLLNPTALVVLFLGMAALVAIAGFVASRGSEAGPPVAPPEAVPTGQPLGCIDIAPRVEEVPCGGHDAVVWSLVTGSDLCAEGLETIYRQGVGGAYCVTRTAS